MQLEKLRPSAVKSSSSSSCPRAFLHAPRTLTGSLRDHSARRGPASPLCSASSAPYKEVLTHVKKSSRSDMTKSCSLRRARARVCPIGSRHNQRPTDGAATAPQRKERRVSEAEADAPNHAKGAARTVSRSPRAQRWQGSDDCGGSGSARVVRAREW